MPPGRARSKGATPAGSWKEGAPGARPSSSPGARDRPGQARHWRALEGNRRARSISTPPSGAAGPRGRRRDRGPAPCSPRASCAGPFTPRQAGARHAAHRARLDEFAGHRARHRLGGARRPERAIPRGYAGVGAPVEIKRAAPRESVGALRADRGRALPRRAPSRGFAGAPRSARSAPHGGAPGSRWRASDCACARRGRAPGGDHGRAGHRSEARLQAVAGRAASREVR